MEENQINISSPQEAVRGLIEELYDSRYSINRHVIYECLKYLDDYFMTHQMDKFDFNDICVAHWMDLKKVYKEGIK